MSLSAQKCTIASLSLLIYHVGCIPPDEEIRWLICCDNLHISADMSILAGQCAQHPRMRLCCGSWVASITPMLFLHTEADAGC